MTFGYKTKVITFNGFGPDNYPGTGTSGPDDPAFAKRILCEGDSWLSIGGVPSNNLLNPMRFAKSTFLVNLARPGDTIKHMSEISSNPTLKQLGCVDNQASQIRAAAMEMNASNRMSSLS